MADTIPSPAPGAAAPSSRAVRPAVIAAAALGLLAAGILFTWLAMRQPLGDRELRPLLERRTDGALAMGRLQLGVIKIAPDKYRVAFEATGTAAEALYVRVDTVRFLTDTLHLRRIEVPPEGSGTPPADPFLQVLVKQVVAANSPLSYQGTLEATRTDSGWNINVFEESLGGAVAELGRKRSSFPSDALDVGQEAAVRQLRRMAADREAYLADRIQQLRRAGEARRSALAAQAKAGLEPGSLFSGSAVDQQSQGSTSLSLEIAGFSPSGSLSARLRNDGGWHTSRLLRGSWRIADDGSGVRVSLASRPAEAVQDGGPFLENAQSLDLELTLTAAGELVGQDRHYRFAFGPLEADQADSLKAALMGAQEALLAATAPGRLYKGTVASVWTHARETLLLRFLSRSADGSSLEARLEATEHLWHRPLAGNIVSNTHRNGGSPLRLHSEGSAAVAAAESGSALGTQEPLDLRLHLEDGALVGEDGGFSWRLAPAQTSDQGELAAARRARARRMGEALPPGIEFDGTVRDDQGYVVPLRLRVAALDTAAHTIRIDLETLGFYPSHRSFAGTCDPEEGSFEADTENDPSAMGLGDVSVPLFSTSRRFRILGVVGERDITARLAGDTRSEYQFPLAHYLGLPAALPPAPSLPGTYALLDGAWVALPGNGAKAVPIKVKGKGEKVLGKVGETLNAVAGEVLHVSPSDILGGDREEAPVRPGKTADLVFDGKDAVPQVEGARVAVLCVRPPDTRGPGLLEVAPTSPGKDGVRHVDLVRGARGVEGFGSQRIAARVTELAPGVELLVATGPVEAGGYAVRSADAFELGVR